MRRILPLEIVEPLRDQPADVALLAGARVADADIHDAPIRIAAPGRRVEGHLAERMNRRCQLHPQQLARRAFERRVRDVAVGPFDHHGFASDLDTRRRRRHDRRRCPVA